MSDWTIVKYTAPDSAESSCYRMEVGLNPKDDAWEQVRVFDDLPLPENEAADIEDIAAYQRAYVMNLLTIEWEAAMNPETPDEPTRMPGIGESL